MSVKGVESQSPAVGTGATALRPLGDNDRRNLEIRIPTLPFSATFKQEQGRNRTSYFWSTTYAKGSMRERRPGKASRPLHCPYVCSAKMDRIVLPSRIIFSQ